MAEVPDFWRTEVFHPLSVHFPIALLLTAFLFKLIFLKWKKEVWGLGGSVLLYLGILGIWIAIFTGDLADGIVSRQLCDPTILKDHENMSWLTAWLFSAAGLLDLLRLIKPVFLNSKKWLLNSLIVLLLAIASGVLMYTGHLGAILVYQQAAGVYTPTEDCLEFN